MVRRIEGVTVELNGDTSGLTNALRDVDAQTRRTTGELRQIDRALQFNPSNIELLEQQQEALGNQIRTTSQRLDVLRQAQAQVQAQFERGEIDDEQYRNFQRQLIVTESQLENFQNRLERSVQIQIDDSDLGRVRRALSELGNEAASAGREIAAGIGAGATAATAGIAGLAIGTQELNGDLARLRTNAVIAGVGVGEAESAFQRLFQVSGEADSSVEAVSQLLASGFQGQQLTGVLEEISGAAIRFSDTLNVEGLSDGLQETLALGEASGQFAELLDRSGVSIDAFEQGLAGAGSESERLQFVIDTLNNRGLSDTAELFAELNPEVAANAEANANLQLALANLGLVLTPIITLVSDLITSFVTFASENPELVTQIALLSAGIAAIAGAFALLSPIVTTISTILPILGTLFGAISAPIAIAVIAITAIVAALVATLAQSESFRDGVVNVFGIVRDFVVEAFGRASDFVVERIGVIKDFWDQNGPQIQEAFSNVFSVIQTIIETVFPIVQAIVEDVISAIRNVIDGGLQFILGIVQTFGALFTGDWQGVWEGVQRILGGALELIFGLIQLSFAGRIIRIIQKFGGDALNFIVDLASGLRGRFGDIVDSATDRFNAVRDAVVRPIEAARDAVSGIVDSIKGFFTGLRLRLPEISLPRLPRVRINGEFSLNPPRVPTFEFYANGGIMTRPTAFGLNPNTGATMVGGEAGAEAILPLNAQTLGTIGRAIANTMSGNNQPQTIVVQSILDGRLVAESTSPFVSQNQQSTANIKALSRGVQF